MRADIRVLWVEDTQRFYKTNSDTLKMFSEDLGINIEFVYSQDAKSLKEQAECGGNSFRKYDIMFVDYSLSDSTNGDEIIQVLRDHELDADILFYSSQREKDMLKIITDDIEQFQGVYVANRDNFLERAYDLVEKNSKRLLSLYSIRGMLMDQTSENDFTMKSFIMNYFSDLTPSQKEEIAKDIVKHLEDNIEKMNTKIPKELEKIRSKGITNIKKIMGLPSFALSLDDRYRVFDKMIGFLKEDSFDSFSIDDYLTNTVKCRNALAHKKLELDDDQQCIHFYDDINQYMNRSIKTDNIINVEDWKGIRKSILGIGQCFDAVQLKMLHEADKAKTNDKES